jgi:hypothetical protein
MNPIPSKPEVNLSEFKFNLEANERFFPCGPQFSWIQIYLSTRCVEELHGQRSSHSENFKCIKLKIQMNLPPKGSMNFSLNSILNQKKLQ